MNIAAVLQMGLVLRQVWSNTRIRVSVSKDWCITLMVVRGQWV